MTDRQTCTVTVDRGDDWHSRLGPCGRKAKGTLADGTPACGIHLNRETAGLKRATARNEWNARVDQAEQALNIRISHAISATDVGRSVQVSLSALEDLAARLRD